MSVLPTHVSWRNTALLFVVFLCFFVSCASCQITTSTQKVRVGFFPFEGYHEVEKGGYFSGYGYDYLQEISHYTGWEYELCILPFNECLKSLEKGTIDLLGTLHKTPEREAIFDFADVDSGVNRILLMTDPSNTKYAFEDYSSFSGMTIGVLRGSSRNDRLAEFAKEKGFTYIPRAYIGENDLFSALANGEVNAIVLSSLHVLNDVRIIAVFGEEPFYYATTKGNKRVLDGLNFALKTIKTTNPYYDIELNRLYYQSRSSVMPSYTREELDFINDSLPIKAVYHKNLYPLAYQSEDGEYCGISAELMHHLEKNTGLHFEFITESDFLQESPPVDGYISTVMVHDFNWANKKAMKLSHPYIDAPVFRVFSPNLYTTGKPIAMPRGYYLSSHLQTITTETIHLYEDYDECMEAIYDGQASATYVNSYTANYYLVQPRYSAFSFVSIPNFRWSYSIGLSNDVPPQLISIINKGLLSITDDDVIHIVNNSTTYGPKHSLFDVVYTNPVAAISVTFGVMVLLLILLVTIMHNKSSHRTRMESLLYEDKLTNIRSYRKFILDVPSMSRQVMGRHFAVMHLDIVRFKYINDIFGYPEGDDLLKELALFLQDHMKDIGMVARVYADHFVALVHYKTREGLETFNQVMLHDLQAIADRKKQKYNFALRVGVYLCPDNAPIDLEMGIDRASYAADTMRNPSDTVIVYYDDAMRSRIMKAKHYENIMRNSLANGEFVAYYQPKVNIVTGKVVGAEALVRWNSREDGLMTPGSFIPFFEENGFIKEIDFNIYQQACAMLAEWQTMGRLLIPISCNFSRLHVKDSDFVAKLVSIARKYGVPPEYLELEITESVVMNDVDVFVRMCRDSKKAGFKLAIDDFGIGYSSLGIVQKLPIDILKLDRSFVETGNGSGLQHDLLKALVRVIRTHDISVICEGVETRDQEAFLKEINCDHAQGYLYARPIPRKDFEDFLFQDTL